MSGHSQRGKGEGKKGEKKGGGGGVKERVLVGFFSLPRPGKKEGKSWNQEKRCGSHVGKKEGGRGGGERRGGKGRGEGGKGRHFFHQAGLWEEGGEKRGSHNALNTPQSIKSQKEKKGKRKGEKKGRGKEIREGILP